MKKNEGIVNNLYVVYDNVALEAGPVFQAKNDAVAIRSYQNLVIKNQMNFEDFELVALGTLNTETLKMVCEKRNVKVNMNIEDK